MGDVSDIMEYSSLEVDARPEVRIEVVRKRNSCVTQAVLEGCVREYFRTKNIIYRDIKETEFNDSFLKKNIESIAVVETQGLIKNKSVGLDLSKCDLQVDIYVLYEDAPVQEGLDDESEMGGADHWMLPNKAFEGIWESLIYDHSVKDDLLQYAHSTVEFTDYNVDQNIIGWNRVILLHGPPGTGKTTLCKGLAQKLCIQLNGRYRSGQFIEINSHSLFSKWFSESGKLVMKLFAKIKEFIDDPHALVIVLIDEVESLTASREGAASGAEPSDAIRVVNAILTQLDIIKKYPNVLILATSNITGAIDVAFLDRADITVYVGPPPPAAVYRIFCTCIQELLKVGMIRDNIMFLDFNELKIVSENEVTKHSFKLKKVSEYLANEGLSGRIIRKLPFIAHAAFKKKSRVTKESMTMEVFLNYLELAIKNHLQERKLLSKPLR